MEKICNIVLVFLAIIQYSKAQTFSLYRIDKSNADTLNERQYMKQYCRSKVSFDTLFNVKKTYTLNKVFSEKQSKKIMRLIQNKKNYTYSDCGSIEITIVLVFEFLNNKQIYEIDAVCNKLTYFDKLNPEKANFIKNEKKAPNLPTGLTNTAEKKLRKILGI